MKKKSNFKLTSEFIIYSLMIISGIIASVFLVFSTKTDSIAAFNTGVSGVPVNKEIIQPYVYQKPGYTNFDLFPLDGDEFDKYNDRFCGEHNVAYGKSNADRILGDGYHISNYITKGKANGKISNPHGDLDTTADVYCTENGSIVRKNKTYYGYKDKDESPADTATTNWIYQENPKTFDCESGHSSHGISDGGFAYILACYIGVTQHAHYSNDPVQHAVWTWINGNSSGSELNGDAAQYDQYHTDSLNPNVDCYPDSNVGTVLNGSTYTVGPFKMSAYVRAQDYALTSGYFGTLQDAFDHEGDFKGTIVKAEAIMNNGARVEFPVPEPNAEFYINLPGGAIAGADELVDIEFTYQRIHASGAGSLWIGHQLVVSYSEQSHVNSSCSYSCPTGGGGCSFSMSPGTTSTPYTGSCTHTWYTGCWTTTETGTGTNADGSTYTYTYTVHHHGTFHSMTHTVTYLCPHGHKDCKYFKWKYDGYDDQCQDGFSGNGQLVKEIDKFTIKVEVPLKTVMKIWKYIEQVDHNVGGRVYGLTDERKDFTMDYKYNNAVWVERGDVVTYRIIITNDSRFPTRVKVKDTLPASCVVTSMPSQIGSSTWIEVEAHDKVEFQVKVRPTKDSGKDTNTIEFITTNAGPEHMQYVKWGDNATHGPHTYGNIVNTDGNDGTSNLKEKDADTYVIKEYHVSVEKFITNVDHKNDIIGLTANYDSSMRESEARYNYDESQKQSAPVYVEYGDEVTYKIRVFNTTNSYKDFDQRVADDPYSNQDNPYHNPDLIYVNIEDILPIKCEDITAEVDTSCQSLSISGGKIDCKSLMVPADGTATITVRLIVTEVTDGAIEENKSTIKSPIRNINYGSGYSETDNLCVIKNNSQKTTSSDWYKLNYYNASVDKYVYQYEEQMLLSNNSNAFTDEHRITNDATVAGRSFPNVLKTSREGKSDGDKKNRPVSVEQNEYITYAIKVVNNDPSNDMANVGSIVSGARPATQVRPTKVIDQMQNGVTFDSVYAIIYKADGSEKKYLAQGELSVSHTSMGGYVEHSFNMKNDYILDPNEYVIYYVRAKITQSNMYLYDMYNKVILDTLTNVNNTNSKTRIIKDSSGSVDANRGDEDSIDYVRMKDLVIAGIVWLDFDKDGYCNDSRATYTSLSGISEDKLKDYYNINENAMKKDVRVKLFRDDGTLLRTTYTNERGLFTFSRTEGMGWYDTTYNHADPEYSAGTTYQRIEKAYSKDNYGNYIASDWINYYIEYEYDGVIYKSTIYAGRTNINADGGYVANYEIDSNATEFKDIREAFNKNYQYITYNKALDEGKANPHTLVFDKTDHVSYLLEDPERIMKSRAFVNNDANESIPNTDLLWLFKYDGAPGNDSPKTEHLKHINLGLQLREDVDVTLTKDVYKVTTLINGEELDYDFNKMKGTNGEMGSGSAGSYLQDYIIKEPYGLELYESDYKNMVEQFTAQAVRNYFGVNGESELNAAVTYRITIENRATKDDMYIAANDDESLDIKISEVLDLYDSNFIDIGSVNTIDVKTYNADGFLETTQWTVGEAWYYKEIPAGEAVGAGERYAISNTAEYNNGNGDKPIYIQSNTGTYKRVNLELATTSAYDPEKNNSFASDGYRTAFIRGFEDEIIHEGDDLDIYVKYVISKAPQEIEITNQEVIEEYNVSGSLNIGGVTVNYSGGQLKGTALRRLKILEYLLNNTDGFSMTPDKTANGRGTENFAQVNAYSVWYTDGKPTSIVDMDSNAGNIGEGNTLSVSRGSGLLAPLNVTQGPKVSSDKVDNYEDTAYKTGVEIVAAGTNNPPGTLTISMSMADRPIRELTGRVWDDSRTDEVGSGGEAQYIGDGVYDINDNALDAAKKNDSVEFYYKDRSVKENKDVDVRNARVEFIQIVQTEPDKYYEQIKLYPTWDQVQHVRTTDDGKYTLRGMTPGRYIVRLTYGMADEDIVSKTLASLTTEQIDMLVFNGQDYKSTQFFSIDEITDAATRNGLPADFNIDTETDYDNIMKALEIPTLSDGRDDEIRRLEVNSYSEVMTSYLAEILKGLGNGIQFPTISNKINSVDELQELVDNTCMNAETVEFMVKPEKATTTTQTYTTYMNSNAIRTLNEDSIKDIIYKNLVNFDFRDIPTRTYTIENVDFGIEYRPEAQISLEKEIREVKLTPQNNKENEEPLVDLFFITEGTGDNKIHKIDTERSIGFDKVQFITNKYDTNVLTSGITTEDLQELQGLIYVQVDEEILQGCKIEVLYDFQAENLSEVDRITRKLDSIRYKNNAATQALVGTYNSEIKNIFGETGIINNEYYTGNETARDVDYINMFKGSFKETYNGNEYDTIVRNRKKTTITSANDPTGYFGNYVGYTYYTGELNDNIDMIAELRFDKILDYIDTDLEFEQNINNKASLKNKYWTVMETPELEKYVLRVRKEKANYTANASSANLQQYDGKTIYPVNIVGLANTDNEEYSDLVVTIMDRTVDIGDPNESIYDQSGVIPAGATAEEIERAKMQSNVNNYDFALFLKPKVVDPNNSIARVSLPTSKVLSSEEDTNNMTYENIAEIIQYTYLTGRRTNFETTIGNADLTYTTTLNYPDGNSPEYATASFESDTAAVETLTLTPPTGLSLYKRNVAAIVDTAKVGIGSVVIIGGTIAIVFFTITFAIRKYKKRRIK